MIGPSRKLRWQEWSLLIVMCWIAFAVRLYGIDHVPLWTDEAVSWYRASQQEATLLLGDTITSRGERVAAAPPLYFVGLAAMRTLAGDSEATLRISGVWAGVLLVPLLYSLGKRLFSRGSGGAAAVLGGLSPLGVWYARAALPESVVLPLATLSILLLHRLLTDRRPGAAAAALWALATFGTLYTYQASIWLLALELLVIAYCAVRQRRYGLVAWAAIVVVLAAPLVSRLALPAQLAGTRPSWLEIAQLPPERLASGILAPLGSTGLRPSSVLLRFALVLPTFVLLSGSTLWAVRYPRRISSWALGAGATLGGVLITLFSRSAAAGSAILFSIPAALLIQGAGAAALWRHGRTLAVTSMMGAASVMVLGLYMIVADPRLGNDSVRLAANYVEENAEEGDVVVLGNAMTQFAWDYYYNGSAPVETILTSAPNAELDRLTATMEKNSRVWLLSLAGSRTHLDPGDLGEHMGGLWFKFDEQEFASPWLEVELEGFTAEPPIVRTLPPGATTSELRWPTGLHLVGWQIEQAVVGSEARVIFYWTQDRATDYEYGLRLFLEDDEGQHWSGCGGPLAPYFPAERWPTGAIVKQDCSLLLSPALPVTRYSLAVAVQRRSDEQYLVASTGKVFNIIGPVVPSRPAEPIDPHTVEIRYSNETVFGETLRFLGYNLPRDVPRPGHIGLIDFFWQVIETPPAIWQQRTRLVAGDGTVWVDEIGPLALEGFDIAQWRAGDLIWGRTYLSLPGHMPAGQYEIELALIDPDGQAVPAREIWRSEACKSIVAGPAYLQNWPKVTEPPEVSQRPDIVFGSAMRLWGFDIVGEPQPGGELDVTLVWYDELPVNEDYHVFVHLMGESGTLQGQADGVPADWTRPTSTWRPGEYIVDQHTIPIGADVAAGVAYLWVGLYHPSGDGRVPVSNALPDQPIDRALLDIVLIEP